MRTLLAIPLVIVVVVAGAAGCPATLTEVCGLENSAPAVDEGQGTADVDGAPFAEAASWAPGPNGSVTIGLLDMIIAQDQTGTDVEQLLLDNALPICVPQRDRSETSGVTNFNDDSGAYVSDASHSGGVALLAVENDVLVGRFEVDVVNANGSGETRSFTNGAFRALRR